MKKQILFLCLLCFTLFETNGQNLFQIISKFQKNKSAAFKTNAVQEGSLCEPDSIVSYFFLSPIDSMNAGSKIFHQYDGDAKAIYTYEFKDLVSIDSTSFNGLGQPVYNEYHEFSADSNAIVLKERSFCYPHAGTVQPNFFFPEEITKFTEPSFKDGVAFDSLETHIKSYVTGLMEPYKKKLFEYSPSGKLKTEQSFQWSQIDMSWHPSSKMTYYYTAAEQLDSVEKYEWNGTNLVLETTYKPTYDANDSLKTLTATNIATGIMDGKLELSYNTAENTTTALVYEWNESTQQLIETIYAFADYDASGKLEVVELVEKPMGVFEDGLRVEIVYLNNSLCPWYYKVYEQSSGGEWNLIGKLYIYPNYITNINEVKIPQSIFYAHAENSGIWVTAPQDTRLQITNIQGAVLYNGKATGNKEYINLKNSANQQVIISLINGNFVRSQMVFIR